MNRESGNSVNPTKSEYRTYSFLGKWDRSQNSPSCALDPALLAVLRPMLEFLANICHQAHLLVGAGHGIDCHIIPRANHDKLVHTRVICVLEIGKLG